MTSGPSTGPPVVVGAGPGGLAVAAELHRRGLPCVVLEQGGSVGGSWQGRYDSLRLHTGRRFSGLPGVPVPRRYGRWVARDDVVAYLRAYAERFEVRPEFGVEVRRIDGSGSAWTLDTSAGTRTARQVVLATGYSRVPVVPAWPGQDSFQGVLVHSSQYREPSPYRGRHVLVVGAGNSAAEIAVDLADAGARVDLSVRTPPNIVRRQVGLTPNQVMAVGLRRMPPRVVDSIVRVAQRVTVGDLSKYGLKKPSRGVYTRVIEDDVIPIIDVGLIAAVKAGQVEIVPALLGFEGPDVILAGKQRIRPDAVIVATGYRRGLERLVGSLGIVDERGKPTVSGKNTAPEAPDLYFTGFTNPISGMFRELKIDARRIARAIAKRH